MLFRLAVILNLAIFVFGVSFSNISESEEDQRILGGQQASVGQYPFMVSLQRPEIMNPFHKFCGGAIIDQYWILTAGHCAQDMEKTKIKKFARAGVVNAYDTTNEHQLRKIKNIFIHPKYKGNQSPHDLALLKLEKPFDLNKYVQTINLPSPNYEIQSRGVIMGFGVVGKNGLPNVKLNAVEVGIASLKWCKNNKRGVTDDHICPGENGKTPCKGDSGSPFVQYIDNKPYVIGVNSFGNVPCANTAAAYVYVPHYIEDFIIPTMQNN